MINPLQTGKLISERRKEMQLTQQQLADRLNLSNKTISKWETGEGSPDLCNLAQLAEVLDLTADELIKGERNQKPAKEPGSYARHRTLSDAEKKERAVLVLAGALGAILGILAYNHGWLG